MGITQIFDKDRFDERGFSEAFREMGRSIKDNNRFLVDHFIKGDGGSDESPGFLKKAFNVAIRFPVSSVVFGATEGIGGLYRGFRNHIRRVESEKENAVRNSKQDHEKQPVVLSIGSDPENTKEFFDDLERTGYDVQHFEMSEYDDLLKTAYNAAAAGKPVAVIGNDLMPGQKDAKGGHDFNRLAQDVKTATKDQGSLTVNYSSAADPHNHDWDEGLDKVKHIHREEWNAAYGVRTGRGRVVLDRFFREHNCAP